MKLKKMKKALKNLERGAVTVSKKDKKYDITECPDKWDDREIVDSYNTEGKNGGITLILGEKSGKRNKDSDSNDIDDLIAKRDELQTKMSQMILNSELILQIAIVESLIKSKAAKEE